MNTEKERRGKGRPREFDRASALETALRIFWQLGYEPASVARLCEAMRINPPSLYATFGNKAALFLEAVRHYEKMYWREPGERFLAEKNLRKAVRDFFDRSADILLCPETPCGCMLVLAAVNISESEEEIIREIGEMRRATTTMFATRLQHALEDGQLPEDTSIAALACAFTTFLEGMSLQARDGLSLAELKAIASHAVRLLPG